MSNRFLDALYPRMAYGYLRLLRATMRIEFRDRQVLERIRESGGRYILAFWHSRFVLMPYGFYDKRFVALLSQHRDARRLGAMLEPFGCEIAWGSTTRGGVSGTRDILRKIRQGWDAGIAPDGPRGPRRRVQMGVVAMARLSGCPIVPASYSARPARRLSSWDLSLVPYPFGRGLFRYGDPIEVARDADEQEQEQIRLRVEQAIDRLTDEADRELGLPVEEPRPATGAEPG